jgi:hypothetical protein
MMEDMAKMPAPSLPISRRDEHESIPGATDPLNRRSSIVSDADQLMEHDDGQWLMHAVSTSFRAASFFLHALTLVVLS